MTATINYTIDHEIKGFYKAMDFFACEARSDWSKEMVLEFSKKVQDRAKPSQFGQGWMDAARIIARTRPSRRNPNDTTSQS